MKLAIRGEIDEFELQFEAKKAFSRSAYTVAPEDLKEGVDSFLEGNMDFGGVLIFNGIASPVIVKNIFEAAGYAVTADDEFNEAFSTESIELANEDEIQLELDRRRAGEGKEPLRY
ncbi:TPA: hypothetical protein QDZ84_002831 [Shewanella algae]|uniref:hypothetical protein n=1 Tax=Shewanella algae TaxID=38313 RepID=UPI001C56DEEE|nr:hypothetical protein [Shewanella algae]HDS1207804.1 hypothetical protein [Shewanella algae]